MKAMEKTGSLQLCKNHIIQLFHILQDENMMLIERIEHQLVAAEACVVCVGSADGTTEEFLLRQRYIFHMPTALTAEMILSGHTLGKLLLLSSVSAAVFLLESLIRMAVTSNDALFSITVADALLIAGISLAAFNILDDKFFS